MLSIIHTSLGMAITAACMLPVIMGISNTWYTNSDDINWGQKFQYISID